VSAFRIAIGRHGKGKGKEAKSVMFCPNRGDGHPGRGLTQRFLLAPSGVALTLPPSPLRVRRGEPGEGLRARLQKNPPAQGGPRRAAGWRVAVAALLAVLGALGLSACGGAAASAPPAGNMLVAASIPPIADLVQQVGGSQVTVLTLVPPGASPHTYEPTPDQMRRLASARLLFLNGVGLEFWADKAVQAVDNPNLQVVVLSKGMGLLQSGPHAAGNPHLWLSPRRAMKYVARIRDALVAADPAHAEAYRANAAAYLAQLQRLDADIRRAVAGFSSREMVTFHASWVYFIHDYGLHQAAVLEAAPGREPSAAEVAQIVETIRLTGAPAVFAEPQFSPRAAEVIAREAGVPVLTLDPLGGLPPRETYLALMRWNLQQLEKGLGGSP